MVYRLQLMIHISEIVKQQNLRQELYKMSNLDEWKEQSLMN